MANLEQSAAKELALAATATVGEVVNAARGAVFGVHDDLIGGFQWSAILDHRTCPRCRKLDGRLFRKGDPALELLGPQLHSACRCILVAVLNEEIDSFTGGGPFFDPPLGEGELTDLLGTWPTAIRVPPNFRGKAASTLEAQIDDLVAQIDEEIGGLPKNASARRIERAYEQNFLTETERKARESLWQNWARTSTGKHGVVVRAWANEMIGGSGNMLARTTVKLPTLDEALANVWVSQKTRDAAKSALMKEYAFTRYMYLTRGQNLPKLYRGIVMPRPTKKGIFGVNQDIDLEVNAASSFGSRSVAEEFARDGAKDIASQGVDAVGYVARADITPEQILTDFRWNNYFPLQFEQERVVSTGKAEIPVTVVKVFKPRAKK